MRVNFDVVITDLKGRSFNEDGRLFVAPTDGKEPAQGQAAMTLGFVCFVACNAGMGSEKTPGRARDLYCLMQKVYGQAGGGEQEMTAKEIVDLQSLLPAVWPPLVVGRADDLLEPKTKAVPAQA